LEHPIEPAHHRLTKRKKKSAARKEAIDGRWHRWFNEAVRT